MVGTRFLFLERYTVNVKRIKDREQKNKTQQSKCIVSSNIYWPGDLHDIISNVN